MLQLHFAVTGMVPNLSENAILEIYRPFHKHMGIVFLRYNEPPPHTSIYMHQQVLKTWKKQDGDWHQIVFTWEGAKGILYVDGLEINTGSDIAGTLKDTNVIRIGNATVRYVPPEMKAEQTGKITAVDKVEIYDYTFTPEQVKKSYEKFAGSMEKMDAF